jgi:hypothetical protein
MLQLHKCRKENLINFTFLKYYRNYKPKTMPKNKQISNLYFEKTNYPNNHKQ